MKDLRKLTVTAVFTALSVVLVSLVHFPLFPAAPYLEYDPADIPILIIAFAYGPLTALIVTLAAAAIQALTVSAQSGIYGFLMHVIATAALSLPAALIYRRLHTRRGALIGMIAGVIAMGGVMLCANHFITPAFTGMPTEAVDALLLPVMLPFNLIKAGINSAVTFLLYKSVSRYIIHADTRRGKKDGAA